MSLLDDIKAESAGKLVDIQTEEEAELTAKLNRLFYLEKDIEKETRFIRHVMTRGQETAERKGLHASAIITPEKDFCLRKQLLSLFYKQSQGEEIGIGLKRIFSEGDSVHEKWQRLFIRGGYAEPEDCDRTRFNTVYNLQYTPDIECMIDNEKYVVEIKSMNTRAYESMLKEGGEHISGKNQLLLYMYLEGIKKGFTLCEDKNNQKFKVKVYKYNGKAVKDYIERLERIVSAKFMLEAKNKIVPRLPECTCYGCGPSLTCSMKDACFRKDLKRI